VNRNFTQTISVRCSDPDRFARLVEILRQWDRDQANADIMGYMGLRILSDRNDEHRYLIVADFGVVDPDVSAADEAARNNERPETQATAAEMRAVLDEDPVFRDYDWEYLTDG
jgi:hypothetical protein